MLHGLLHHFGGLQHERQNQLARAELVADFLHRREQHLVQHAHRLFAHAGRVERRFDAVLLAMHDHPVDLLIRRHRRRRILLLGAARSPRSAARVEMLDEPLQRVGPAIEHQIVGQRALVAGNLGVRLHVRRIHDRHVEPRLDAVVQEH